MQRLYNLDYYSYNKEGQSFSNKIQIFLQELVRNHPEYDFSDMESVASSTVGYVFAVERLTHSTKQRK